MISFDFNEYFVKSVGFKTDPDFDAENPFDGPDLNDEKAFKLVVSPSQAKLCIIHPKVLRWITVAKQKLKELTDLTRRESTLSAAASAFVAPSVADFLAADSPSSGTTINERQMMENVDQDIVGKIENSADASAIIPKNAEFARRSSTMPGSTPSLGKRGRGNWHKVHADNDALPAVPDEIRSERLDHRMTIGEALDYWWGGEGAKKVPECYRERVNVIVTIRSLYEPTSSKQVNCRVCWWCVRLYKRKISVWAMFVDETPRRTCQKCRERFLRRTGCQTSFEAFWIELPRIFDHCTGQDALRRLIAQKLCSRYINNSYQIVGDQLIQTPSKRGPRPHYVSSSLSSSHREKGEVSNFSPPAAKLRRRFSAAVEIKPEILDISQEEDNVENKTNEFLIIGAEISPTRKNGNLAFLPEIYANFMFDEHQTLEEAVDFWWSEKSAAAVKRPAKRVEILKKIRNIFEGFERKPNDCCWWCGVIKQKNSDLQYSLAFADETPRMACEICRKKCLDSALCITRTPDPRNADFSQFVWWNLPPIYDNLSGRQALKQLSIDKLLFTKKKPTPSGRRRRLFPPNNAKSTPNLPTKNQDPTPRPRWFNSSYDACIPDVFLSLDFDGRQTIGQAADFWFNLARDANSDETLIARGKIVSKIRSLHQGEELFGGGENDDFCWWCGDRERKNLRWCRGVFSCEVSRYICANCYHSNYRHVGCITKMPVEQADGSISNVWWLLPRIMDNPDRTAVWNKLRKIGVVHDHVCLSKKRSQIPSSPSTSTPDVNRKGCELENSADCNGFLN